MAIVEMSKLRLVAIDYDRENILNALQKTGAVEISETEEFADTFVVADKSDIESIEKLQQRADSAVEFISETIQASKNKSYYPENAKEYFSNFFVSYDEFLNAKEGEKYLLDVIEDVEKMQLSLQENKSERVKLDNLLSQLLVYLPIKERFDSFQNTKYTSVFFGTCKSENLNTIKNSLSDFDGFTLSHQSNGNLEILCVITLSEYKDEVSRLLTEQSFVKCPFDFSCNAKEKIQQINETLAQLDKYDEDIKERICKLSINLKSLKILTDYYRFALEKQKGNAKFRKTGKTFLLEGFVPTFRIDEVKEAVNNASPAVFIEFTKPKDDEDVPTLTKNNSLVKQSEFVTDLYSVPNYKEIDPNKVTFFFFMLFMGIIMADVGYGVIMILFGLALASRIKVDNGARRLWNVVAIGGVSSIIFGFLFNSFFGIGLLPFSILPSPTPDLETGAINLEVIMTLLLACLGLGVVHIAVGYFCKALNCFKQGDIAGGIFDGLIWVLFFIGLVMASFNFLMDYLNVTISSQIRELFNTLQMPGIITVVSTVLIAAITAGRDEKGFGKFSKGFGAVYGLINIMSDVLSYARLFGLMLSGMIVAQTFNYKLGLPLMQNGVVGAIFGVIVIIVGHVFNIAMNVLGAYIHDSRLQYIEFFSKFYTGEGRKFTPIGSQLKYVYLKK